MGPPSRHSAVGTVWELAASQHGVVEIGQLYGFGLSKEAIRHRVARGRLHPVSRGVFAVGRPEVDRRGRWMAAVLACGSKAEPHSDEPMAVLSHRSAAAHWGIVARGR